MCIYQNNPIITILQSPKKIPPAATEYFAEDIGKVLVQFHNDIKGNFAFGCHNIIMNSCNYLLASQKFQESSQGTLTQPDDKKYVLESKYILAVWQLLGIGSDITGVSQNVKQSIEYLKELVIDGHMRSL